jgi:hypothetical protein
VPAQVQSDRTLELLLARLGESHEVSVYEAIERLLHAAELVELDQAALIRMLDQGMSFEELLELVESKLERQQTAA